MTIDKLTGLPELPDPNMFWNVEELYWNERTNAKVTVELMMKKEEVIIDQKVRPFYLWPFGGKYENIFRKVSSDVILVSEGVFTEHDGLKRPVFIFELTPELILEHAEKALDRYFTLEKARGLLGKYPPKTLNKE